MADEKDPFLNIQTYATTLVTKLEDNNNNVEENLKIVQEILSKEPEKFLCNELHLSMTDDFKSHELLQCLQELVATTSLGLSDDYDDVNEFCVGKKAIALLGCKICQCILMMTSCEIDLYVPRRRHDQCQPIRWKRVSYPFMLQSTSIEFL